MGRMSGNPDDKNEDAAVAAVAVLLAGRLTDVRVVVRASSPYA